MKNMFGSTNANPISGGRKRKSAKKFMGLFKLGRTRGRGQMLGNTRTRGRGQSRSRRGGIARPYSESIWTEPGKFPEAVGGKRRGSRSASRSRKGGIVRPYSEDIWTENGKFPEAVDGKNPNVPFVGGRKSRRSARRSRRGGGRV